MSRLLVAFGILWGLSLLWSSTGFAQDVGLARHKRIFAVPAPKKVVIDGSLSDWDLSGQIFVFVTQQTSEMMGMKVAMMYDAQALYLSADIRDTSPMMNRHDPLVEPHMAWDADCFQLRMMLNPKAGYPYTNTVGKPDDQLVTCNFWYYTDRKEPCLQIGSGGDLVGPTPRPQWAKGVVPHDSYQAAYVEAKNHLGYVFEYRIPWKTLGAVTVPKAGDILACNVQYDWSTPDGMHSFGGGWSYDVMNGPGFPFQSSYCWGKAVFADKGHLSRDIVELGVKPEPPAPLKFNYTLPQDADVTIALKNAQGQFVRHLVTQGARRQGLVIEKWDGLDDIGKPLPAGHYTWEGIYHDPITTKYLLSVHNSGSPAYPIPDGTGGWGADHSNPTTVCAAGEKMLLAWAGGEAGWGVIRTDLHGRRQWGIREGGSFVATDGGTIFVGAGDSVLAYAFADGRPINFRYGDHQTKTPEGGGKESNTVSGLAYANGRLYVSYVQRNLVAVLDAKQGTVTATWPVPTPGGLAVRPDGALLVLSAGKVLTLTQDGAQPLISDHLDAPVSLATDAAGIIYVANAGALQNISVFDTTGHYLRAIGKTGGRPRVGDYDSSGILEPGGIAVDQEGKLWVAETLDSPKRISAWDTHTGALQQEFFGGSEYSTFVSMDPKHADEVFCHDVIWQVDLDKGTWKPKATMWRSKGENSPGNPMHPAGTGPFMKVFTAKNGHQYSFTGTVMPVALSEREGNTFVPFVVQFQRSFGAVPFPIPGKLDQYHDGDCFAWQDGNNDQVVQTSEVVAMPQNYIKAVDDDLNLYSFFGVVYRPVRFETDGRPVYDFTKAEKLPVDAPWAYLYPNPQDGGYYTIFGKGQTGFARWTKDGTLCWSYMKVGDWHTSLDKPIAKPGEIPGCTIFLGVAGDFAGIGTYQGPFNLFTSDGLFVAQLFKDGRLGTNGPDVICAEAFAGQIVRLEQSGRYLYLGGDQDGRVTEILGLQSIRRMSGEYTLTEDDVVASRQAQEAFAVTKTKGQLLTIVRGRDSLKVAQTVGKTADATRDFSASVAYDAHNLYVAYTINSPFELTNSYADWKTLFKGGNCLDLQFAAETTADPKRKEPAPGDVRILVTRQNGQPIAVVYRPKVKNFTGVPLTFTTVNKITLDRIDVNDKVQLVGYQKTPTGFTVTVVVPLDVLGWTPKPGSKVKMDVGYIFGNSTGNQVAMRTYWSNNSFAANCVGDVPNEIKLEPDQWGMALVE